MGTRDREIISKLEMDKRSGIDCKAELFDIEPESKHRITESACSDDDGSLRTVSSADQTPKSTSASIANAKISKVTTHKSSSQSNIVKTLVNEVREMKDRIRKLEDEVSTVHEVRISLLDTSQKKKFSHMLFSLNI